MIKDIERLTKTRDEAVEQLHFIIDNMAKAGKELKTRKASMGRVRGNMNTICTAAQAGIMLATEIQVLDECIEMFDKGDKVE